MSKVAESLAGAALRLAELGWYVLALRPGTKAPATDHGVHDASRAASTIRKWWSADAARNVGVAAGEASGLVVVDIDSAAADEQLAKKAANFGGLPPTVTSRTPRGRHLYFRHCPGLRNRTRLLELAVDVRTDGGYVVAPPSTLPGSRDYSWEASPWTTEVAPLPSWLRSQLETKEFPQCSVAFRSGSRAPDRYGAGALRSECAALARATTGTRNDHLNRSAFRIGRLLEACGIDESTAVLAFVEACKANGLVRDDGLRAVLATIQSGLSAGRAKPRTIDGGSRRDRG